MGNWLVPISLPQAKEPSTLAGNTHLQELKTERYPLAAVTPHRCAIYATNVDAEALSEGDINKIINTLNYFLKSETARELSNEDIDAELFSKYSFNAEDYELLREGLVAAAKYIAASDHKGEDPARLLLDINDFVDELNTLLSPVDDIVDAKEKEIKDMFKLNRRPDGQNYLVKRMGKADLGSPKYAPILKQGIDYLIKLFSVAGVSYMSTTHEQHLADKNNRNNWVEILD